LGKRILSVCPFVMFTFSLLDGGFTGKLHLPAGKGGQQQGGKAFALSNFGIHFWPRVTLVKLLKRGIGGYLIWIFQFWGGKRPQTLLNVYFIASHLNNQNYS
jgi:hypothetical protein